MSTYTSWPQTRSSNWSRDPAQLFYERTEQTKFSRSKFDLSIGPCDPGCFRVEHDVFKHEQLTHRRCQVLFECANTRLLLFNRSITIDFLSMILTFFSMITDFSSMRLVYLSDIYVDTQRKKHTASYFEQLPNEITAVVAPTVVSQGKMTAV